MSRTKARRLKPIVQTPPKPKSQAEQHAEMVQEYKQHRDPGSSGDPAMLEMLRDKLVMDSIDYIVIRIVDDDDEGKTVQKQTICMFPDNTGLMWVEYASGRWHMALCTDVDSSSMLASKRLSREEAALLRYLYFRSKGTKIGESWEERLVLEEGEKFQMWGETYTIDDRVLQTLIRRGLVEVEPSNTRKLYKVSVFMPCVYKASEVLTRGIAEMYA